MQQSVTVAYPTSAMRTQNARPATRCHIGRAPGSPQSQGQEPPRQNLLVGESCGYGMGFWASQCPFVLPCAEVALWRPPLGAVGRRETPPPPKVSPGPRRRGAGRRRAGTPTADALPAGHGQLLRALLGLRRAILSVAVVQVASLQIRDVGRNLFPVIFLSLLPLAVAVDERIAVGGRSRTDTFPALTKSA
jgi:hypothetical protein